jgi:hypothetical protein
MTRALQHQVRPDCPLACTGKLLPAKPLNAVRNYLTEQKHVAHPTVRDVIALHQQSGLTGIRGLSAEGIETTATFPAQAALVPARATPGGSCCNPNY